MDFTIPITIQQFRVPIILFCHRMQIAVIIAALNVGAWEQHHCLRLILWTLRRGVINVPTAKWFKTVWACLSVSMADIRTATEPYFRCAIPFASERRSTEWCFSIKVRSGMMPHITAETEHGITWIKGEHSWTLGLIFCAVLFQHWFFSLFLSLSLSFCDFAFSFSIQTARKSTETFILSWSCMKVARWVWPSRTFLLFFCFIPSIASILWQRNSSWLIA